MNLPNLTKMTTLLLTTPGCKRVTKYLSPSATAKVTYQGRQDRRNRRHTVLVTLGTPNFAERKFIKLCQKAGEPFPVRKLQTYIPRRRAA